jgi:hypothetical protein
MKLRVSSGEPGERFMKKIGAFHENRPIQRILQIKSKRYRNLVATFNKLL